MSIPWSAGPPRSDFEAWVYQRRQSVFSNATQIVGALLMARSKSLDGEFSQPCADDYREIADQAALLAVRLNQKIDDAFPRPEPPGGF